MKMHMTRVILEYSRMPTADKPPYTPLFELDQTFGFGKMVIVLSSYLRSLRENGT